MARISGVDIPNEKRIEIALTYIYGIGPSLADKILATSGVNKDTRAKNLTEDEIAKLTNTIQKMELAVEGELKRSVNQNIRRLQEIKCYRGIRHSVGLPVRGQRTKSNSRTRKGKKKTVGGQKKKLAKK